MSRKKMHLAAASATPYGASPYAWLEPGVDPHDYDNIHVLVRAAQAAERGMFDFLFLGDFLAQTQRSEAHAPNQTLEPTIVATAIALATERIGLVTTVSATFQEPYNIARVLKSLDVVSGGRMGWNAVTTSSPQAAANFGRAIEDRDTRYARADEVVQIVQALWGSWEEDAWIGDQQSRKITDLSKISPVNLRGTYVSSRGPLEIPPSKQGQPVMAHAGTSPHSLAFAGRYADILISEVFTIEEARHQRAAVRRAAESAGRSPDDVKFFVGVMPTIASTHAEALARRGKLIEPDIEQQVRHLGQLLGLPLGPRDLDAPLSADQLAVAYANPGDPRSPRALEVAKEGWTVRQVLHHAVIDYHPSPIGPPEVIADHLQEWFEADAADGFWVIPGVIPEGMDSFVDGVIPILQQRGLFRTEYEGETLRENLGVDHQYGPQRRPQTP
ncbi:NtaA/DmoA family FMN-dependent monooxygenase [Pseudarthrobacter sp. BRE9]|uniref:NtaA/DmoA family FMN-dependent monooxygenase n=1 Tax=Pseudarthrobacter sp. BRE9 TaxID=2962582 RepID=UPI0028828A69|nr:NtaA/DmoA family FMN-dependent monooxygenase [Pseudarthrobacter sp. BRE9]MDT0170248.1 NtaA/DmoA family FMN-dependent monooxygenase [Pseudarthrobacter sp. BRE9]